MDVTSRVKSVKMAEQQPNLSRCPAAFSGGAHMQLLDATDTTLGSTGS